MDGIIDKLQSYKRKKKKSFGIKYYWKRINFHIGSSPPQFSYNSASWNILILTYLDQLSVLVQEQPSMHIHVLQNTLFLYINLTIRLTLTLQTVLYLYECQGMFFGLQCCGRLWTHSIYDAQYAFFRTKSKKIIRIPKYVLHTPLNK